MVSPSYQIIDNWDDYNHSKKEEIAQQLFFHDIINDDIPDDANVRWKNTSEHNITKAKNALKNNSFSEFWMFLDVYDKNSIELEIRTYADFINIKNNTLITKRLIYTSHVSIHEQETYIQPEINIALLS